MSTEIGTILEALEARLKTIAVAAGYRTDAGADVTLHSVGGHNGRDDFFINILAGDSAAEYAPVKKLDHRQQIHVVVGAAGDDAWGVTLEMAADVQQALGTDWTLSGAVSGLYYQGLQDTRAEVIDRLIVYRSVVYEAAYQTGQWGL